MTDVKNKTVTVVGLGKRTGVATAKKLCDRGARVIVSDIKSRSELREELSLLKNYDIEYDLGGHSKRSLRTDLIVVSPGVPLDLPFFSRAEEYGIPVIGEIELAYRFTDARIIAITGTNGKTTTTRLLGEILREADLFRVKVAGNIGTPLIRVINGLDRKDWIVVEVSSFQLETIDKFRPDISIYLNFSPDHLDRHHSEEEYWAAKKRIFMNQTENDRAIINLDDSRVIEAARDCQASIYGVSLREKEEKGAYLAGDKLVINYNKKEFLMSRTEIVLPGVHNIQNILFAGLAARMVGVSPGLIREVSSHFSPEAHRLQRLGVTGDNVVVYDDSKATNPDAAVKALQSFTRPVVLIAGGQDRKADFGEMARVIADNVKSLILLGETRNKLAETVLKTGFENIYIVNDMKDAVARAAEELSGGECLLLSPGCPSWDMYSSYTERGQDFRNNLGKVGLNVQGRKHT